MRPSRTSARKSKRTSGPSRINVTRNTTLRGKLPPINLSVGLNSVNEQQPSLDDKQLGSPVASLRAHRSTIRHSRDSSINVLGSRESRMRMRAKIDKRRQVSLYKTRL